MLPASDYAQICLDASVNCEILLKGLGKRSILFSSHIAELLSESAHICMGTFYAVQNNSVNLSRLALLCIGICDECADACETINHAEFQKCADICKYCSNAMSELSCVYVDEL